MEPIQKLPSRSKTCFLSGDAFAPGEIYFSQMRLENEGWKRFDYSQASWDQVGEKGEYWEGFIPLKTAKKKDSGPLELFQKRHHEDPLSPIVYLLALYLEREKVLIYRPSLAKLPTRCYEEPMSGELYCVTPVTVSDESAVLNEIGALLTSDS